MAVKIHRVLALPASPVAGDYYLVKTANGIGFYAAKTDGSGYLTLARQVKVSGPTSLYHGETGTFTLKNYTDLLTYQVTSADGTVTLTGDTFTFVCTDTAKTSATIVVNGRSIVLTIKKVVVNPPTITSPVNGSSSILASAVTITAAPFSLSYNGTPDTHVSSDWELSTSPTFATIAASSYNDTINLTTWKPPA